MGEEYATRVGTNREWPDAEGDEVAWQLLVELPLTGTGHENAGVVGRFMEAITKVLPADARIAMRRSHWVEPTRVTPKPDPGAVSSRTQDATRPVFSNSTQDDRQPAP